MIPLYMPFTHLPAPTARVLNALVGPVGLYQPLATAVCDQMRRLETEGCVEIRTPISGDEERLAAALAEFTAWGQMNPGRMTPGADFLGAQQGQVPFFDETAVNRIRSDIRNYQTQGGPADADPLAFTARLFLALAQANDQAQSQLDEGLDRFQSLENKFKAAFPGADEAAFSHQTVDGFGWREDPGARLTQQRLRAWAALVAADPDVSSLLVTTSRAVVDTLLETHGGELCEQAAVDLSITETTDAPLLANLLTEMAAETFDPAPRLPDLAAGAAANVSLRFYHATLPPATLLGHSGPSVAATTFTRIILVES